MAVHIENMCHAAYFKCMFRTRKKPQKFEKSAVLFLEFVSAIPN